jgi:acyl-CoA dehydrogenase
VALVCPWRYLLTSIILQIDKFKAKGALKEIGIAKVIWPQIRYMLESHAVSQFVIPSMALTVVDRAMQSFGAEGLSQDQDLAGMWANVRTLRIADACFKFLLRLVP